jgi:hypothetical protein
MTSRTQITLDREMQRQARARAAELGISLAEYVRRLVARDLGEPEPQADPTVVFALGNSGGSDIARDKDRLAGEAWAKARAERRAQR